MKSILAILAVFSVIFVASPSAQASDDCHRRVVSYTSCGRPIYATYQIYGYDRCGNPVGRWVTQSSHCSCSVCNPRPVYSHPSYPRYPSYGGGHHRSGGSCDNHHRGSGFYFSFGR